MDGHVLPYQPHIWMMIQNHEPYNFITQCMGMRTRTHNLSCFMHFRLCIYICRQAGIELIGRCVYACVFGVKKRDNTNRWFKWLCESPVNLVVYNKIRSLVCFDRFYMFHMLMWLPNIEKSLHDFSKIFLFLFWCRGIFVNAFANENRTKNVCTQRIDENGNFRLIWHCHHFPCSCSFMYYLICRMNNVELILYKFANDELEGKPKREKDEIPSATEWQCAATKTKNNNNSSSHKMKINEK